MAFQSKSIAKMINGILERDYVLPAIQRHFVWKPEQIINLFDSVIRGYPIGSFLFWRIKSENVNTFQYYDFIKDFNVKNNFLNQKFTPSGEKEIIAVLDGQQRLTALLIGLIGSYTYKTPYLRQDHHLAYQKRELYLNLANLNEDSTHEFAFLTIDESKREKNKLWYKVGRILNEGPEGFILSDVGNSLPLQLQRTAFSKLSRLSQCLHSEIINFYVEEEQDIDKVLSIFIRVNSGGTILSYSDLLLSTATALWNKYDAREEIENLIQEFASYKTGLKITSDFVMKASLTLSDLDVKFIVKNFNRENTQKIESEWEKIKESLLCVMRFVIGYGYNQNIISSYNALLPIAYFIKIKGISNVFDTKQEYKESRNYAITWLRRALLKKVFGGSSDTELSKYREVIFKSHGKDFPYKLIENSFKNISLTEDDIEGIFEDTRYGKEAFYVLHEIFGKKYNAAVDMDHLYPKSLFTQRNMKKWGFKTIEKQNEVLDLVNSLANLCFSDHGENMAKGAEKFGEWIKSISKAQREALLIPKMKDYSPEYFIDFCKMRTELMKKRLKENLLY